MDLFNTAKQLQYDPTRPLIICDADEVLFHFIEGLEKFLTSKNYTLTLKSFALTGNIHRADTGQEINAREVRNLVHQFFREETANMRPVDGAAECLSMLAQSAQILILSNLPADHAPSRAEALEKHGMDYPLLANTGPKGPVVKSIVETRAAPLFFIDDLPLNLKSVKDEVSDCYCIHYVANERLGALVEQPPEAAHRARNWSDLSNFIEKTLGEISAL